MKRCLLSLSKIIEMRNSGHSMDDIAFAAGVTRQAIYLKLKESNNFTPRRSTDTRECEFCGTKFTIPKKKEKRFCSVKCFHKSREILSESNGGAVRLFRRLARKTLIDAGVALTVNQVVHHIDGNIENNSLSNLMVFDSHSEHMKFHHSLDKKVKLDPKGVKTHRNQREGWSADKKRFYTNIAPLLKKMNDDELEEYRKQIAFTESEEVIRLANNYRRVK